MKKICYGFLILFFITGCGQRGGKNAPEISQVWSTGEGLAVPESVMHDPARNCLYVSNINGKPLEKNGKGFIARLSPEGKILKLKWAEGLNAPKGMAITGSTLYVTDIDRLHAIDTATGKITLTVVEPKAEFLNDIAVSPAGDVYISDMTSGIIYLLQKKVLKVFIELKSFEGSNGMLMQGEDLLVGSKTGIVKVDLAKKKASLLVPVKDYGMIDGLKAFDDSSFLMSNWAGKTQMITRGGKVSVLLDTTSQNIQSADLEYIAADRMLIIPTFFNNRVVAYKLK